MGFLASGQSDLTVGGDQMDPIYRVEFTEGHQQFFRKNVNPAERAPFMAFERLAGGRSAGHGLCS
jgi:hypothetical protein